MIRGKTTSKLDRNPALWDFINRTRRIKRREPESAPVEPFEVPGDQPLLPGLIEVGQLEPDYRIWLQGHCPVCGRPVAWLPRMNLRHPPCTAVCRALWEQRAIIPREKYYYYRMIGAAIDRIRDIETRTSRSRTT